MTLIQAFGTRAFGSFGLAFVSLLSAGLAFAQSTQSSAANPSTNPHVLMSTTMGDFVIELDKERAPQTVANFLQYVDDGFYEETIFHRVIEGFMIQGGGFSTQFQRKTTRPPVSNEAYNGLRNERYTIAMARTTAPHSATSQFFINSVDNQNLDHTNTSQRGWGYTVFGKVIQGHEIIDAISQVRTGSGGSFSRDVPLEPVIINGVQRLDQERPNLQPAAGKDPAQSRMLRENMSQPVESDSSIQRSVIQTQPVEQN